MIGCGCLPAGRLLDVLAVAAGVGAGADCLLAVNHLAVFVAAEGAVAGLLVVAMWRLRNTSRGVDAGVIG